MKPTCIHDKGDIEAYLRQNVYLHIYEIGDLDDFFWQYTTWYAHTEGQQIKQLALVYTGTELPVLVGVTDNCDAMRDLLRSILPFLPRRMHVHLSGDVVTVLADQYTVKPHGPHYKMALTDPDCLNTVDTSQVAALTPADQSDLETFYDASYPGNWFDPRMLETGQYFGIRHGTELVSVAGIHVYSPRYRVAALGNITTHPQFRGEGLAAAATARLCQSLLQTVEHIGLNVRADNASAIACYKKLGFTISGTYAEYSLVGTTSTVG